MKSVIMRNEGAGWYAPKAVNWIGEESVEWYWVGGDQENRPETYQAGLGTPVWTDDPLSLTKQES